MVFTTLTREAMPLIRYRTGDLGQLRRRAVPLRLPLRLLAGVRARRERRRGAGRRRAAEPRRSRRGAVCRGRRARLSRPSASGDDGRLASASRSSWPSRAAAARRGCAAPPPPSKACRPWPRPGAAGRLRLDVVGGRAAVVGRRRHRQAHTDRRTSTGELMKEIVDEVLEQLEAGQDFALVRLVAEQGSTPRQAGAEMLVRRDGSIAGTIGGGLLEASMMRGRAEVLERRRSEMTGMGLRGTDVASPDEMICGGSADVLIAYVAPGDPVLTEVCTALREAAAGPASRLAVHRAARRRGRRRRILPAGRRRHRRRRPALRAGATPHRRRQDRRARHDEAARRPRGAGRGARAAGHGHHLRRRPRGPGPGAGRGPGRLARRGARRSRGVRQPAAVPRHARSSCCRRSMAPCRGWPSTSSRTS